MFHVSLYAARSSVNMSAAVSRSSAQRVRVHPAVQALLRAFRARRPLRSGSLLVTIFGDSIAPRGGEAALGSLIALARPLGLSERLVRTSIGRLAQEDWLESARVGRLSYYRLTERGRRDFALAIARIYGATGSAWSGAWTLLLLGELDAAEREALAADFRWRGFGRPMPGVLAYPGERLEETRRELARHANGARVLALSCATGSLDADLELARRAWDLEELRAQYVRLVRQFAPVERALRRAPAAPLTCFVVRTLLIHAYRRVHLRDPLLPSALLPASWTGAAAAELCRSLYRRVYDGAERFVSAHARNRAGPLPPAVPESLLRFRSARPG